MRSETRRSIRNPRKTSIRATAPRGARQREQMDMARWEITSRRFVAPLERAVPKDRGGAPLRHRLVQRVDELEVISRLVVQPMCTRFLFGRENVSFLGASPEILFDKREAYSEQRHWLVRRAARRKRSPMRMRTSCSTARRIFRSIVRRRRDCANLAPFCEELRSSKRRRCIAYARSFICIRRSRAAQTRCACDLLLEALHPTPAVGGLPTAAAAEWIAQHESGARAGIRGRSAGWTQRETRVSWSLFVRLVGNGHAHVFTALVSCSNRRRKRSTRNQLEAAPNASRARLANTRSSQSVSSELPPPSSGRARALLEGCGSPSTREWEAFTWTA